MNELEQIGQQILRSDNVLNFGFVDAVHDAFLTESGEQSGNCGANSPQSLSGKEPFWGTKTINGLAPIEFH